MKAISSFVFMIFFSLSIPCLNAGAEVMWVDRPEQIISMDFQDANLKDILKVFSIQSGSNFIASEAVQDRKITLYLDKVPLQEAMDKLFKANNLSYEWDKESNIFIVKDWGKPQIETVTKVFYLKYATVSSSSLKEEMAQIKPIIGQAGATVAGATATGTGKWQVEEEAGIVKAVKKILSGYGSVIEDYRTNSLVITDIPSRMPIIAQTIAALDVPVPQAMLEVEMLDVSKNTTDKLGIKFGQTPFTAVLTGASIGTMWPFSGTSLPFASERKFTPGSLAINTGANTYTAFLDFLKTQSDTKLLARPRILTLNNETAEIKIATKEAIGTITTTQGQGTASTTTTSAERIDTGVSLRVTPQINLEKGEITMFIVPTVRDATTSTFNTAFKDPEERSSKSTVRVKDGETIIIGGLIRNERSETITKFPILGDIPVLGALFRHRSKDKDKERELLVFITPHIIKDTGIELAQVKTVNLPEREQNTVSGIDRQTIISTSLNNFEKKKK